MNYIPESFLKRMELMLGQEYDEFVRCLQEPPRRGLRLNTLKCTEDLLKQNLDFPIERAPFSHESYYLPMGVEKIGLSPLHHAGAFYLQEPSAASAVTVLSPQSGEKVLDLCAAPGGKSTQIAAMLKGKGLLWANEVVKSRASVLLSNLERLGVRNSVVSCCRPDVLCARLKGFFDKVLVDAPCSGEGMFRKDENAAREWSIEHTLSCADRQSAILDSASEAVKEDGVLVYSTCTFSLEENEGVVRRFLQRHPDFRLEKIKEDFGRPGFELPETKRIFPMDGGEGHFVACLRRLSENDSIAEMRKVKQSPAYQEGDALYRSLIRGEPFGTIEQVGDSFVLLPEGLPNLEKLGVLRAGVLLGERRKNRIEPAHALFMAELPENLYSVLHLSHTDLEMSQFLRGEEIDCGDRTGYIGVAVDGIMTGFGKGSAGRLKNRYPKGLRNSR